MVLIVKATISGHLAVLMLKNTAKLSAQKRLDVNTTSGTLKRKNAILSGVTVPVEQRLNLQLAIESATKNPVCILKLMI